MALGPIIGIWSHFELKVRMVLNFIANKLSFIVKIAAVIYKYYKWYLYKWPLDSYASYLKTNSLCHKGLECAICLVEFKWEHKVKCLECSPLHIFHQKCLTRKVKNCPLCRAKI